MSLREYFLDRMSPGEREIERRAELARELMTALRKDGLPVTIPNRELASVVGHTRTTMDIPRESTKTLYPPSTGPIFTDPEGNNWNLDASNEGFSLRCWRPLPPTPEEPGVSVSDEEFLSAQLRLSHPLFGTVHESWTSHKEGRGAKLKGRATNTQSAGNDEVAAARGREFIRRFAAALRSVPAEPRL